SPLDSDAKTPLWAITPHSNYRALNQPPVDPDDVDYGKHAIKGPYAWLLHFEPRQTPTKRRPQEQYKPPTALRYIDCQQEGASHPKNRAKPLKPSRLQLFTPVFELFG
ncbi:MAG: hypothetical protein O2817_09435, partial [Proteobacteria bacterium]|nr:hypothetical protein [Pseudomonadota bacterium]